MLENIGNEFRISPHLINNCKLGSIMRISEIGRPCNVSNIDIFLCQIIAINQYKYFAMFFIKLPGVKQGQLCSRHPKDV